MLQQDFLEGRFGWWRQLSGGNYYASVLQFFQAEKSIRLRNLVKDGYTLKDVKVAFEDCEDEKNAELENPALLFAEMIESFDLSCLSKNDKPITYYVAGYIARRLIKKTKCTNCHILFSESQEQITVEVDFNDATEDDKRRGKNSWTRLGGKAS